MVKSLVNKKLMRCIQLLVNVIYKRTIMSMINFVMFI